MLNSSNLATASGKQLIEATLQGDVSFFGNLVQRYWNMTIALALSKIQDPIEAEDIAQESFLKAYSQLHKLRNPCYFAGWLSKIVEQQCANFLRKKIRNQYKNFACIPFELHKDPKLTERQANFVRQTVSKLPEKLGRVVIMRFIAGLSASQIAQQLDKRQGAVRVRLHRAYKILRKDLAPLLEEVEELWTVGKSSPNR